LSDLGVLLAEPGANASNQMESALVRQAGNPDGLAAFQEVCVTNRRMGTRWALGVAVGLFVSGIAVKPAAAQSTIFNIPSTDTVAPKKAYFEFDYLPQVPGPDGGDRFQTSTPRIVFGVSPQVEAGVNVSNTSLSGTTLSLFQPNLKYKFYSDDMQGMAATAGFVWYIPINHRDVQGTFGLVYANFSKKVGKDGPRFTIGPYGVVAGANDFSGTKGGILAGYEQPLSGKVSFVADWFSSKNFFGYFTPGISITLPANGLLNIGYSIGNDSFADPPNHNRTLFVYYGITFP
jgi:hypothetical protein